MKLLLDTCVWGGAVQELRAAEQNRLRIRAVDNREE